MQPRRKVLATIGTVAGVTLAGCTAEDMSDGDSDDEESDNNEETETYPNETHTHEPEADSLEFPSIEVEQRGNELYAVGKVHNPLGRPLYRLRIRLNFLDELDDLLGTERVEVYALRHGDTWNFEKQWDATLDEKSAASRLQPEISSQEFANPQIPEMNPEDCGNVDDWMCDGRVTINSINEDFVTTGASSEEWTVSGEITAIADEGDDIYTVVAHYVQGGEIVADGYEAVPIFPAGGTNDFRIEFGETQPQGNLRMTLLDDTQLE